MTSSPVRCDIAAKLPPSGRSDSKRRSVAIVRISGLGSVAIVLGRLDFIAFSSLIFDRETFKAVNGLAIDGPEMIFVRRQLLLSAARARSVCLGAGDPFRWPCGTHYR